MTQQVFADFIGTSTATLSGIYNDRTRPTINIVEAIKKKIPDINTDWLLFGAGDMYVSSEGASSGDESAPSAGVPGRNFGGEARLDFDGISSTTPQGASPAHTSFNGVKSTRLEMHREDMKTFDKPPRKVTEIRVYYDDQTWESFVPSKK